MAFDREKPRQDNVSKFFQYDGVEILTGRLLSRPNPTGNPNPQLTRPVIEAVTPYAALNNTVSQSGYTGVAMMSLDGLVRPVSVSGDGQFPQFTRFLFAGANNNSSPPQPPFIKTTGVEGTGGIYQCNLLINQYYLNPLINPLGYTGVNYGNIVQHTGRYASGSGGHDWELVGQKLAMPSGQHLGTVMGSGSGLNHIDTYSNDYRFLALRGPIVMTAWGYDTEGKPVPNERDVYATVTGGNLSTKFNRDRFMPDFMQKPHAWPVGPIDLRWDRKRGVWVSPQNYKNVKATAQQDIFPLSTGHCILHLDEVVYDTTGVAINNIETGVGRPIIIANDQTNTIIQSGERLVLSYDYDNSNYTIVENKDNGVFPVVFMTTGFYQINGSTTSISLSGRRTYNVRRFGATTPVVSDLERDVTGALIRVYNDMRPNRYPIFSGYQGWCQKSYLNLSTKQLVYDVIDAETPYKYIHFRVTGSTTGDGGGIVDRIPVSVLNGWGGRAVPSYARTTVRQPNQVSEVYPFGYLLSSGDYGTAILDESKFTQNQIDVCYQLINKPLSITDISGCYKTNILPMSIKRLSSNDIGLGSGLFLTTSGATEGSLYIINSALTMFNTGSKSDGAGVGFDRFANSGAFGTVIGSTTKLQSPYLSVGDGLKIAQNSDCTSVPNILLDLKASGNGLGTNSVTDARRFSVLGANTGLTFINESTASSHAMSLILDKTAIVDGGLGEVNVNLNRFTFSTGFHNYSAANQHLTTYSKIQGSGSDPGIIGATYNTIGHYLIAGNGLRIAGVNSLLDLLPLDVQEAVQLNLGISIVDSGGGYLNEGWKLEAGAGITISAGSTPGAIKISLA